MKIWNQNIRFFLKEELNVVANGVLNTDKLYSLEPL